MDILEIVHSYLDIGFNAWTCSKQTMKFNISHYNWKFISSNNPDHLMIKLFPEYIIYRNYIKEKETCQQQEIEPDDIGSLISFKNLTLEEMEKIPRDYLNMIFMFQSVNENFIRKRFPLSSIEWDIVFTFQTLSEEFLEEQMENWTISVWKNQKLSEEFINKHFPLIPNITVILENQKLSEDFVMNHLHEISDLKSIYVNQELSDEFYERYKWFPLSIHKKTSNYLIKKYVHHLDVNIFLMCKKHPEHILDFVISNVELNQEQWNILWLFQSVSENFIKRYRHKIYDQNIVIWSQDISIKFVQELTS